MRMPEDANAVIFVLNYTLHFLTQHTISMINSHFMSDNHCRTSREAKKTKGFLTPWLRCFGLTNWMKRSLSSSRHLPTRFRCAVGVYANSSDPY